MDDMDGESTKLRASLTSKIREILRDSSVHRVLKEGVIQPLILHKARLSNLSISGYEIQQAALIIAHAMVNPYYIEWDVDRYAEMIKIPQPNHHGTPSTDQERLQKYFPLAVFGRISTPATIVDKNGKLLMMYLPNILSSSRLDYVNSATKGLRSLLLGSIPTPSTTKGPWRSEGFIIPDGGGEFGAGRVTVSPAYFMQRLE
ncbi:hypothetical protein K503DRAFT_787747, partial [Rhizopogon vinicolor AM-OR11-026]